MRIGLWLERASWIVGITGALWIAAATLESARFRTLQIQALAAAPVRTLKDEPSAGVPANGVLGVLEIPRLKFTEVVAEGDDEKTLKKSIGHLPDTPLPWRAGNSVLAGHRDTHFRALRAIRVDDEIRLRTPSGVLTYRVVDKMIVNPADVWVLDSSNRRRLTLVTCYPFTWVGNAPQRFIVKAEQTGP